MGTKGYKHTEEFKKSRCGEGNPFYGKEHTAEFKEEQSKRMKEDHPNKKPENKKKLSESLTGEKNPNFKFGKEVVGRIFEMRELGHTYAEIAKETGVSLARVGAIIKKGQ